MAPTPRDKLDATTTFTPKLDASGLMPAIAVDHQSGEVLMLAYVSLESLALTRSTGEAHYWSRSRQEIWHKGATSGHTQTVHKILLDCDQDTLILRVTQMGAACHTGRETCFYREVPLAKAHNSPAIEPNTTEKFELIFTSDF